MQLALTLPRRWASPLDNGIIERLHRRPAVGRRNYLFAGSHEGAKRAAIAYSALRDLQLARDRPVAYLADVLLRSPESVAIAEIRPHARVVEGP
ncbi:MAG: transposase [Polyangiaceae bacterium]|nr:transposase [Polyangiaceae bacterium]